MAVDDMAGGPVRPRPGWALAPAAVVLIGAGATLGTAFTGPGSAGVEVGAFGAAATVLLALAVAIVGSTRAANGRLRRALTAQEADSVRLVDEIIPGMIKRLRDGTSAETAVAEATSGASPADRRVLRLVADEVARVERTRAAAMAACANAAGRVQALTTSMLADLREMEDRLSEEVLPDLLKLDHNTAQAGRLADSIAVLTGARSGRRWTKPITMESVLRGALGRIGAYQRIRLHSTSTAAIVGHAAEGVMHALAELMDNATNFSPPSEEVHVYVETVQAGIVVTIEDGGLVMGPAALERARMAVSTGVLDLTALSGTRLGLAVVGALARKHGLTVSFRPSSRGGTGAVVMIPQRLVTEPVSGAPVAAGPPPLATGPAPAVAGSPSASVPARGKSPAAPASAPAPGGTDAGSATAAGLPPELPKRRRGETLASAPKSFSSGSPRQPAGTMPRDAGARFGAFRQAVRGVAAARPVSGQPAPDQLAPETPETPETPEVSEVPEVPEVPETAGQPAAAGAVPGPATPEASAAATEERASPTGSSTSR